MSGEHDPFDGAGELETARALSKGNARALALCEMASALCRVRRRRCPGR